MSDVADLFESGTFKDEAPPDEPEEATGEVVEEPDEGGTDDNESNDQEAPSEAPLIFGKYKTMEDAEKAYKEAERALHESRQPQAEPEQEEDADPFGLWGTALGSDEGARLADLIINSPREAQSVIEWAQENQHQFGPQGEEIYQSLYALWNAQNPLAAHNWATDQRWAQHEAKIQEQQAPLQSHYTNQMAALAVHRATTGPEALPRFAEFKDQIMASITSSGVQEYLQKNPEFAKDPEKMFELLKGAWTNCVAQEYLANQQHATVASGEPAPATPTEKAKPRTQQRSTAAPPASGGIEDLFEPSFFKAQ